MPTDAHAPSVSVLVPIYNVERYLEQCLDSLVAQTFTDFEAILINDGSTDGSRDIMARYMEADGRFRAIDKPNSGYGASMNRGLDEARGTYVAILESDDFFEPDALERLHDAIVGANADVAKANFWLYWSMPEERRERFEVVLPNMSGRVCRPLDDEDRTIFYQKPSLWSAMYSRAFLDGAHIRFLETPGASYQDASFNFKVWASADRVVYLDDCILSYRQDNEASSINNPGKVYCVCDEYAEMERFLASRPEADAELRGVFERMKFDSYMWNAKRLSPGLREEFLSHARDELKADWDAGLVDQSVLGVYKRTDLRYLLEDYPSFLRAFGTYGDGSASYNLKHYLELGGPVLVTSMFVSKAKQVLPDREDEAYDVLIDDELEEDDPDAAAQEDAGHAESVAHHSPRLSVVVPVYNVEDYLDECLASLEAQSFEDFEAVCVNDGSTDSSRELLERWALDHSWIRIVDKPNGGLSSARNAGIRAAKGEYVCFLDSDDRLLANACGRIVDALDASDASVLVYGGYALPREATWEWLEHALSPHAASYEGYSESLLFGERLRPFAWRTAARRDFLLGQEDVLLFDEDLRYGEDQAWQFLVYALSPRTEVIEDRLYEYRVNREGSLLSNARMDGAELLREHINIMSFVLKDMERLGVLRRCEAPMLRWLARFVAHDALMLDTQDCADVLAALGVLVGRYWSEDEVRAMPVARSVRAVLCLALKGARPNKVRRRTLQLSLHRSLFWRKDV